MVEAAQTTAGCLSTSMTGAVSPGAPSQSSRHPPSIRSSPRRRNGTGPPPNTHRRSSPAKQRPGPRSQPGDRSRSVGRRWRQRRPVARLRHYRAGRVPSSRSKGGSNLRHGEGCSICHGGRSVTWRRRFDRRTRRGSPRTRWRDACSWPRAPIKPSYPDPSTSRRLADRTDDHPRLAKLAGSELALAALI